MPWYWMVLEGIAFLIVLFGVPTLIAALFWHLYRKVKGGFTKPLAREYDSYSHYLVTRGFMSTAALYTAAMAALMVSSIGANITARLPGARVVVETDVRFTGEYVLTERDLLPEGNRKHLGSDDVLFISASPMINRYTKEAYRPILRASGKAEILKNSKTIRLVETRRTKRYPAQMFRWLGPLTSREDVVIDNFGKKVEVSGLVWWSTIRS
jgi:hypothetical protein